MAILGDTRAKTIEAEGSVKASTIGTSDFMTSQGACSASLGSKAMSPGAESLAQGTGSNEAVSLINALDGTEQGEKLRIELELDTDSSGHLISNASNIKKLYDYIAFPKVVDVHVATPMYRILGASTSDSVAYSRKLDLFVIVEKEWTGDSDTYTLVISKHNPNNWQVLGAWQNMHTSIQVVSGNYVLIVRNANNANNEIYRLEDDLTLSKVNGPNFGSSFMGAGFLYGQLATYATNIDKKKLLYNFGFTFDGLTWHTASYKLDSPTSVMAAFVPVSDGIFSILNVDDVTHNMDYIHFRVSENLEITSSVMINKPDIVTLSCSLVARNGLSRIVACSTNPEMTFAEVAVFDNSLNKLKVLKPSFKADYLSSTYALTSSKVIMFTKSPEEGCIEFELHDDDTWTEKFYPMAVPPSFAVTYAMNNLAVGCDKYMLYRTPTNDGTYAMDFDVTTSGIKNVNGSLVISSNVLTHDIVSDAKGYRFIAYNELNKLFYVLAESAVYSIDASFNQRLVQGTAGAFAILGENHTLVFFDDSSYLDLNTNRKSTALQGKGVISEAIACGYINGTYTYMISLRESDNGDSVYVSEDAETWTKIAHYEIVDTINYVSTGFAVAIRENGGTQQNGFYFVRGGQGWTASKNSSLMNCLPSGITVDDTTTYVGLFQKGSTPNDSNATLKYTRNIESGQWEFLDDMQFGIPGRFIPYATRFLPISRTTLCIFGNIEDKAHNKYVIGYVSIDVRGSKPSVTKKMLSSVSFNTVVPSWSIGGNTILATLYANPQFLSLGVDRYQQIPESLIALGKGSHAEGSMTTAMGDYSHAEGEGTLAGAHYQHVFGRYNIEDFEETPITEVDFNKNHYTEIVGWGTLAEPKNIRTLDRSGNMWVKGTISSGNLPVCLAKLYNGEGDNSLKSKGSESAIGNYSVSLGEASASIGNSSLSLGCNGSTEGHSISYHIATSPLRKFLEFDDVTMTPSNVKKYYNALLSCIDENSYEEVYWCSVGTSVWCTYSSTMDKFFMEKLDNHGTTLHMNIDKDCIQWRELSYYGIDDILENRLILGADSLFLWSPYSNKGESFYEYYVLNESSLKFEPYRINLTGITANNYAVMSEIYVGTIYGSRVWYCLSEIKEGPGDKHTPVLHVSRDKKTWTSIPIDFAPACGRAFLANNEILVKEFVGDSVSSSHLVALYPSKEERRCNLGSSQTRFIGYCENLSKYVFIEGTSIWMGSSLETLEYYFESSSISGNSDVDIVKDCLLIPTTEGFGGVSLTYRSVKTVAKDSGYGGVAIGPGFCLVPVSVPSVGTSVRRYPIESFYTLNLTMEDVPSTTVSYGTSSIASGQGSISFGAMSLAMGTKCTTSKSNSIAFGHDVTNTGKGSIAIGENLACRTDHQFLFGKYNSISMADKFIETIAWGTKEKPANLRTLDFDGNEYLAGNLKVGGTIRSGSGSLISYDEANQFFARKSTETVTFINHSSTSVCIFYMNDKGRQEMIELDSGKSSPVSKEVKLYANTLILLRKKVIASTSSDTIYAPKLCKVAVENTYNHQKATNIIALESPEKASNLYFMSEANQGFLDVDIYD